MDEKIISDELLAYFNTLRIEVTDHFVWDKHYCCFPSTKEGLYTVYREREDKPLYVERNNLVDYPWIHINYIWDNGSISGLSGDYCGVNELGVALVVLEIESKEIGKKIVLQPTIICQYDEIMHFIYRLKRFMPKKSSMHSRRFFAAAVDELETATKGLYIYDNPILNPFCSKVKIVEHNSNVFELKDFKIAEKLSDEEIKKKREQGRIRQAEAGRATAKKRQDNSLDRICKVILNMKLLGLDYRNKSEVAKAAKLTRRTVQRNWSLPEIQELVVQESSKKV
jgi:hypothetical protein